MEPAQQPGDRGPGRPRGGRDHPCVRSGPVGVHRRAEAPQPSRQAEQPQVGADRPSCGTSAGRASRPVPSRSSYRKPHRCRRSPARSTGTWVMHEASWFHRRARWSRRAMRRPSRSRLAAYDASVPAAGRGPGRSRDGTRRTSAAVRPDPRHRPIGEGRHPRRCPRIPSARAVAVSCGGADCAAPMSHGAAPSRAVPTASRARTRSQSR